MRSCTQDLQYDIGGLQLFAAARESHSLCFGRDLEPLSET